jgi:hypothetical protein
MKSSQLVFLDFFSFVHHRLAMLADDLIIRMLGYLPVPCLGIDLRGLA